MSTELGNQAEKRAADWLVEHGFTIRDRNWRTRWCEVDIVADKKSVIHIVEVKYRKTAAFGTGFDYITSDKSRRLIAAAQSYIHDHNLHNSPYQIDIMALTGQNIEYLPNAIGED